MSEAKRLAGGGGTVRVGGPTGLALQVCHLSVRHEDDLIFDLRRLAAEQAREAGDDFIRAVEPILDRLDAAKTPAAAARARVVLATAAELAARRELPGGDVVEVARRTPRGVALELWWRAKPAHPSLQLRELEAVITEANARDVFYDLREALAVEDADPKPTR